MNTCFYCGKPLPTSLDEFGDADAPVCLSCFFTGAGQVDKIADEIKTLEAAVEYNRECMAEQAAFIAYEEDQCDKRAELEWEGIEEDRELLQRYTENYENSVLNLSKAKQRMKSRRDEEQKKFQAWVGA